MKNWIIRFLRFVGVLPQPSRIIMVGAGASGKDLLKQRYLSKGFTQEVSFTTRPMREGEKPGFTYHYISEKKFKRMIKKNKFIQYKDFRGWLYGTAKSEWYSKDLFIMTPEGLEQLSEKDRASSFVIYIDIPEDIRRKRLEERNDFDDVQRRLNADREQFENFTDYDMIIRDPLF